MTTLANHRQGPAQLTPGMKICPDCGFARPAHEFHKNAAAADGLQIYCKPHQIERVHRTRQRRAKTPREWAAQLESDVRWLREQLRRYGSHDTDCTVEEGGCSCGLHNVLEALPPE